MKYIKSIVLVLLITTLTGCSLFVRPFPVADHYLRPEQIKLTDVFKKQTAALHKNTTTEIVIQKQHSGNYSSGVTGLKYSPDGSLIATCSEDGLIKIWDVKSGNLLHNLENKVDFGKEKEINDASFSPDGKYIATAGQDGSLKIWDIITGTVLKSFSLDPTHAAKDKKGYGYIKAKCVDYSPDGKSIVAGGFASISGNVRVSYYPLRVIDIASGKEVLSMKENIAAIGRVKFSPNGKLILSGDDFRSSMKLWDAQTGILLSTMAGAGHVESVAFSPDSQLAAGGFRGHKTIIGSFQDGKVNVWNLKTGAKVFSQKNVGFTPRVKFSPDGRSLFIGDDNISIMNLANGALKVISDESCDEFDISPDGKQVAIVDRGIILWDIHNKKLDLKFKNSSAGTTKSELVSRTAFGYDSSNRPLRAKSFTKGAYSKHYVEIRRDGKFVLSAKIPLVGQLEFSKNGKYLFVASHRGMKKIDISNRTISDFSTCSADIFDFSPDGKYIIGANYYGIPGGIGLWNAYTNKFVRTFGGHNGSVNTLKFTDNGRLAISTGDDATTRYWNVKTGELICFKMESKQKNAKENKEWLVVSPSGHFDKSPGFEGVHFVKGLNVLELDQLFDEFYTPGLLAQSLKTGGEPAAFAKKTIDTIMASPPPTVEIISPKEMTYGPEGDKISPKGTIEVVLKVKDNGGGIKDITLFHNGKPVEGKQRGLKKVRKTDSKSEIVTFQVTLLDGKNTFMAVAKSRTNTESRPFEATLLYRNPDLEKPDAYLVIVGINKYKNTRYNLNYGRADAEAISNLFKNKSKKLFETIHITEIYDEKATKNNIRRAFEAVVKSARPKDVFVLYYAGHGVMVDNKKGKPHFYIAPHEVTSLYREKHIWANGISAEQLTGYSKKIKARKQMLIMDACQAGGFEQTFAMRGAVEEKALKQLSRSSGLYLLAATQSEQFATEFASLKHGAFTYAVLKGLQGEADGSPKDGKITVRELSAFIEDKVPGLTEKHRGSAQYPSIYGRGQDFPILLSQ